MRQQVPSLWVYSLKQRGMTDELNQYMDECKKHENNWRKYSLYVHGYFIPWLQMQRETNSLVEGRRLLLFSFLFVQAKDRY